MSARPKPPASVARAEIARLAAVGVNPVAKAPRLRATGRKCRKLVKK
jgi:hypothetical protein